MTREEFLQYQPYLKRLPNPRLSMRDFEANGVNIPKELWKGLQRIEDPVQYMEYFLRLLAFMCPKINAIDIQHELNQSGETKIDFKGMSVKDLMQLARNEE